MGLPFSGNVLKMRASYLVLGLLALSIPLVSSTPGSTRCKNEYGEDVDWFILYKLPKLLKRERNSSMRGPDGGQFVYVDSDSPTNGSTWKFSNQTLYESSNPLAYTLEPLYRTDIPQGILYVVYNDQSPDGYNGTRNGHSKGVVMFDEKVGIWLLHSVPKFLKDLHGGNYTFPENARENAQIFVCVTFPSKEVDVIAKQLRMQYAKVYDKGSSMAMLQRHTQMDLLFKDSFIRGYLMRHNIVQLTSLGGKQFISVAKRATHKVDIYSSMLSFEIKDHLIVQSWRNGDGEKLPNDCSSKYTVTNVDTVKLNLGQDRFISFNTTKDHSKWAIAVNKSTFCFGSMNRMKSQSQRGGEALCFENSLVNRLFKQSAIVNTGCPVRAADL